MADASIAITAGTGTSVDTRTESTNGNHRQVIVIGDPATNAGVAPVDATAGLKVDLGTDNDITGTVTANLSATDNAVLDAIAADTGTIAGDTTSIDAKIPALGQALAAASVPVVLTAAQLTTLTPPAAITGFATAAKQDTGNTSLGTIAGAVSGTEMQVDVLTMPTTTVQATNLDVRDLSSASDTVTVHGDVGVIDQLDLTNSNPAAVAIVDADGTQITSFGGGTQYTEGDTDATITGTAAMVEGAANALAVMTQPLTDTQLRAADVKITLDGESVPVTGTFYQATQPVSGTVTANLSATDNAVLDDIASDTEAIKTSLAGTLTVTGGGGGTEYTEDAAAAANPVGTTLIMVREDARAGSLTTADGDNVAARGNNKGELYVKTTDSDALLTTIDADTSNISTKIDTLAGAVAGTEVQVDVLTMPTTTITGTVTANLSATDNAVLDAIEADTTTIAGAVSGTEMQVDIVSAPTLTVNAHAVTNAGTFATQIDGAALTSLQLADDVVATLGTTTYTEATTKGTTIGAVRRDADTTLVDTTNEIGPLQMDANGRLKVEVFDGGDSHTVDGTVAVSSVGGTVAVTQSGTWDEVGINDSGNSITVDYATTGSGTATGALRVELPTNGTGVIATVGAVTAITNALPAGTNAIGKLAANSGVDIGDVDVTSLPALAAGTNAIGKLLPPDVDVTTHTNYARKYYTSAGAATDGIVWSPAAGKRWHVVALYFQVSAAATVTFEDDKAGGDDPVLKGEYAANGGAFLVFPEKYPMASGEDAADLLVTTSAGNIYVTAVGYEI